MSSRLNLTPDVIAFQTSTQEVSRMTESRREENASSTDAEILILGVNHNTPNYGVRVLLSGAVESISRQFENVHISVLDYEREPCTWREPIPGGFQDIELINMRFNWKVHLPNNILQLILVAGLIRVLPSKRLTDVLHNRNPWISRIAASRACFSLAGGDSFSDIYGFRRFLYVSLPQILVLVLRKPLILLPQTYGPFASPLTRIIARAILKRAVLLCSRDAAGEATVRKLLLKEEVRTRLVPDLGFVMTPEDVGDETMQPLRMARSNGPIVGLNISKLLYMGGYSGKNMFGLSEDYPLLIRNLMVFLLTKLKVNVLLIPHVIGKEGDDEDEVALCISVHEEFCKYFNDRVLFVPGQFNHRQMKKIIGQCDLVIGSRMHACIAAVSQGVPCVGLAYSNKFEGVMRSVCDSIPLIDLRKSGAEEVCRVVEEALVRRREIRAETEAGMIAVKRQIREFFRCETLSGLMT